MVYVVCASGAYPAHRGVGLECVGRVARVGGGRARRGRVVPGVGAAHARAVARHQQPAAAALHARGNCMVVAPTGACQAKRNVFKSYSDSG